MMRIDKLLANLKYGSRKQIDQMVRNKRVFINGKLCTTAKTKVDPVKDEVLVDDELVYYRDSILLMMNKPSGYVSVNHDDIYPTVFEFVMDPYHRLDLHVAGRLDVDTEGLLLLTNDGQLLHDIIHPKKNVYKEYFVTVDDPFSLDCLTKPMTILDGNSAPFKPLEPEVEPIDDHHFILRIREGKFHQVKRMVEHCGRTVVSLKRTKIGDLALDESLAPGEIMEVDSSQFKS